MCTCISFKTKDAYFGRTMDLDYNFGEKVVITPRNYKFELKNGRILYTKHAIIGMATVVSEYPLYADACNEVGLAIAGLNFKQTKKSEYNPLKYNITPYELIPYILGQYSTVDEVKEVIPYLNIVDIDFNKEIPAKTLHWMISDSSKSIVLEYDEAGLEVYDNPFGVLTNTPAFKFHLTFINNFMGITPNYPKNAFSDKVDLKPYCLGMGAIGLPGDNSSTSRFVRACFNKLNSVCNDDEESSIAQVFNIFNSVGVCSGTLAMEDGKYYKTTYTCCMNITKGIYYYKTYINNQVTAVRLGNEKYLDTLTIFDFLDKQKINFLN